MCRVAVTMCYCNIHCGQLLPITHTQTTKKRKTIEGIKQFVERKTCKDTNEKITYTFKYIFINSYDIINI